jgi:hypothetical protein
LMGLNPEDIQLTQPAFQDRHRQPLGHSSA